MPMCLHDRLQVARNVTTNELANWHRYKYLQTPSGQFHNPFSKGRPRLVAACDALRAVCTVCAA